MRPKRFINKLDPSDIIEIMEYTGHKLNAISIRKFTKSKYFITDSFNIYLSNPSKIGELIKIRKGEILVKDQNGEFEVWYGDKIKEYDRI
jgi:hypothetical protein